MYHPSVFAQVLLPLAVPEPLTYLVPQELEGAAQPGVRVRVPLRSKTRVGLILELAQETEVPVEKVLPILGVLDLAPMVPPHILEMIRFVADYYWCPAGLVAKACLPPKVLQQTPESVELGPRAVELLPELSGEARRLVEILLGKKRTLLSSLRSLGFSRDKLSKLLPELQNRQILRLRQPEPPGEAGRMVSALAVVEGRGEALLTEKQRRLLEALQARGGWALEAEVASDLGFSRAVADALVKKGLLRRFYQVQKPTIRRWELPPSPPPLRLTPAQEQALEVLERALGEKKFQAFLLLGVTGSGKTEVYLRACEKVVAEGGKALILVPEIGLTPKLAGELSARFGSRVAVVHSSLPAGERFALWERARRGEVDVVAGPRSALWAPLAQLKLVVVDEEQDPSYKQGEEPRYNARDLALVLGKKLQIPVVLASATPSLETFWLCLKGKVQLLELPERVAGLPLPEVEIVSLTSAPPEPGEHGHRWFSPRLVELLQETLARGEQAILLLNRRGWAPVMLCRDCGYQLACNNCAIPLTLHRRPKGLVCHYCGFTMLPPPLCPRCGGGLLVDVGAGTEKVAELLKRHVPGATVGILDRDTAHNPARLLATLADFSSGRIQVLVGTQMVSKGHHFPKVTLTAVINADNLLGFPDFRGAEKTWQLLVQVAGRAGRGQRPGRVVVQTYHPEHHAVQAAATQDVKGFLQKELTFRRAFRYPPVHRMALVRFEAAEESRALRTAEAAYRQLPSLPGLRVLGPAPSPISRLRGRYRVQMLFLGSSRQLVREALQAACKGKLPQGVRRIVDVDPVDTI